MLTEEEFKNTGIELFKKAVTTIPEDIKKLLRSAYRSEKEDIAKTQLKNILDNIKLAETLKYPLCQDTGIPIFFIETGKSIDFKVMERGLREAVIEATEIIPLRPNAVDPLTRKNTGNTGKHLPIFHYEFTDEKILRITLLMKGAGAENMSRMKMMKPSDDITEIKKFVIETVKKAGGNPCPPTIVGVGIGGTSDYACFLAKKSLLKKETTDLEREILEEINTLNIGPMGLGGRTTSLRVCIETAGCHTASLPVAVNLQCWAHRVASVVL
ncbi:MAG: fumarate hydratase [Methanomicrobia archaeon]|nr:fumarate hydratase [Methanomicrobia archaeon]